MLLRPKSWGFRAMDKVFKGFLAWNGAVVCDFTVLFEGCSPRLGEDIKVADDLAHGHPELRRMKLRKHVRDQLVGVVRLLSQSPVNRLHPLSMVLHEPVHGGG